MDRLRLNTRTTNALNGYSANFSYNIFQDLNSVVLSQASFDGILIVDGTTIVPATTSQIYLPIILCNSNSAIAAGHATTDDSASPSIKNTLKVFSPYTTHAIYTGITMAGNQFNIYATGVSIAYPLHAGAGATVFSELNQSASAERAVIFKPSDGTVSRSIFMPCSVDSIENYNSNGSTLFKNIITWIIQNP